MSQPDRYDDSRMQAGDLTADILVPKEFVWWTFLALAADPLSPFARMNFVPELSVSSDVAIIDSRLLPQDDDLLRKKSRVAVLLWDGYQSYLEHQELIDHARLLCQHFELHVVGSTSQIETRHSISCKPLFVQSGGIYNKSIFSSERFRRFSFQEPSSRLALRYRSKVMNLKALSQLVTSHRLEQYKHTRFVYCGQSGLETLKSYAADYELGSIIFPTGMDADFSERPFLSKWLSAIRRRADQWTNDIVLRSLLRWIALKRISEMRSQEVFLNIYPDPNVNAYQAGMLFRKHTFLDFGGVNGDEKIYPRAADILFHQRETIRFDPREAMQRLREIDGSNDASIDMFLSWYAQYIRSRL
jgi:hypothetical protein